MSNYKVGDHVIWLRNAQDHNHTSKIGDVEVIIEKGFTFGSNIGYKTEKAKAYFWAPSSYIRLATLQEIADHYAKLAKEPELSFGGKRVEFYKTNYGSGVEVCITGIDGMGIVKIDLAKITEWIRATKTVGGFNIGGYKPATLHTDGIYYASFLPGSETVIRFGCVTGKWGEILNIVKQGEKLLK
jgi:hypothetical protein